MFAGASFHSTKNIHTRISNHDDFLQGNESALEQFFNKDVDKMTPQEIIMYKIYIELLHAKRIIEIKDPLKSIRLDPAMRKKFDVIHGIYHEQQTKAANDCLFKPYSIEIIPISCKKAEDASIDVEEETVNGIAVDADLTRIDSMAKQNANVFRFYTVYDFDGDGSLDRHDFNCEYRINDKLVELTEIEVVEALEKMNNLTENRIYEIFHNENYVDKQFGRIAVVWYIFIMSVVFLSIIGAVCGTVESLKDEEHAHSDDETFFSAYWNVWEWIEMISTFILTFEYVITIFMVRNKHIYVFTLQNVIDFLAITPWYMWIIVWMITDVKYQTISSLGNLLLTLRVLRLFRTRALSNPYVLLMVGAVREFARGTGVAVGIIVSMVCLFMGSLMFAAQSWDPDDGGGFTNIFMGMWFVIVTMSTVGYGDISPTTPFGYFCGLLTIVVGVTVFSMILMVTGQYYSDLLNDYNNEITDIKQVLLSLVNEDADEFRKELREESGEDLYHKVEYALRCEKHKFVVV